PSISRARRPVIDDIVADVQVAGVFAGLVQAAGKTPVPIRAIREQVVVVTANVAADGTGKRVRLQLGPVAGTIMRPVMQCLRDDVTLERDILCAARTGAFVRTPTDRAMIHDAVVAVAHARAVHRALGPVTNTETHVADDDIMRAISARAVIRQTDAVARRSLSGDGAIRVMHRTRHFEMDDTGYTEDNCARTIYFDCRAKAAGNNRLTFAGIIVFQVRYFDNPTAATAARETSIAFRRRKRQSAGAEPPDFAFDRRGVGPVDFIHAPEISVHLVQGRQRVTRRSQVAFELGRRGRRHRDGI